MQPYRCGGVFTDYSDWKPTGDVPTLIPITDTLLYCDVTGAYASTLVEERILPTTAGYVWYTTTTAFC